MARRSNPITNRPEPVLALLVVVLLVAVLGAFLLGLTAEQVAAAVGIVGALVAIVLRQRTTPT